MKSYFKKKRAESVFRKCLQNNKIVTAMKIAIKHDVHSVEESCDDVQISLGLSLIAKS